MFNFRRATQEHALIIKQQFDYEPQVLSETIVANRTYAIFQLCCSKERLIGAIDLVDWCRYIWPEMAGLAWEYICEQKLLELFKNEVCDKKIFSGVYSLQNIDILSEETEQKHWLKVRENPVGWILLSRAPIYLMPVKGKIESLRHLSIMSRWIIGTSNISYRLLNSLELRDVLLVQNTLMQLKVSDRAIATFLYQDQGATIVDILVDNEDDTENDFLDILNENPDEELITLPIKLSAISVVLTFVLSKKSISLDELSKIQAGFQFELEPEIEKKIQIYANNHLFAEGELIYIDDALGVEVTKMATLGKIE
ncbi:type III secretion apparatus protein [Yersinia nurmii]|uniref:Surface presentation of antigens protein SpaO n=1 Tax=Yersinia nurmii TaxID=685706 RepID=A0ABP1YIK7_9GAMM|nr:FliM/FliN family flagellar motor switch protein [Yersinia nurmii]CNF07342.1 type III secretion apparatus protein [Yersinia nurmii]